MNRDEKYKGTAIGFDYHVAVKPGEIPNSCGNCQFYDIPGNWFSRCNLRLPPWVQGDPSQRVLHSNSCSFHNPIPAEQRELLHE